jgi:hypothetical protein
MIITVSMMEAEIDVDDDVVGVSGVVECLVVVWFMVHGVSIYLSLRISNLHNIAPEFYSSSTHVREAYKSLSVVGCVRTVRHDAPHGEVFFALLQ